MTKTLAYYNENAKNFSDSTLTCDFSYFQDKFLKTVPEGSHILDLGCGAGRDALYFKTRGRRVTLLDGSEELCKIASDVTGEKAVCMRFEDMAFKDEFDAIWACASLLHVEAANLVDVLKRCCSACRNGGTFYLSFKYGEFEGERNGRYFTDMTEKQFMKLVEQVGQLEVVDTEISGDVRPGREQEKWLNVYARIRK